MTPQPLMGQGLLIIEASRSHSIRHTTLGRTPLNERSARHRDLYLTKHNIYKRHTTMPPAGFEPSIPASKRSQTYSFDRVATGTSPNIPDGIPLHYEVRYTIAAIATSDLRCGLIFLRLALSTMKYPLRLQKQLVTERMIQRQTIFCINSSLADSRVNCLKTSDVSGTHSLSILFHFR
jgi:hypothetical protein